jgi:hypothetical protein
LAAETDAMSIYDYLLNGALVALVIFQIRGRKPRWRCTGSRRNR